MKQFVWNGKVTRFGRQTIDKIVGGENSFGPELGRKVGSVKKSSGYV